MIKKSATIIAGLVVVLFVTASSCGSKSNKRAVNAEDLDKVMQEEAANAPAGPTRSILSADEMLQLSRCVDVDCLQLYMKDLASNFVHAKKGEFASLNRGTITDTAGNGFIIPFSTLYYSSNPGETWRIAHTIHKKELSDELLNDFASKGFSVVDSFRYYATKAKCYRYTSAQFPNEILYYSPTFTPWYFKGLYKQPTWVNYVFEIHSAQ